MPELAARPLQRALSELTRALRAKDISLVASDLNLLRLRSYSWFHKDAPDLAKIITNIFASQTDEDRVHFAERYADSVLETTGLDDAIWFRKGVWKKEALPTTLYPRHRDHSVHTLHNYLLGWLLFIYSDLLRTELERAFQTRQIDIDGERFILRFGEVWCFASLLHDVGYLFEGQIPDSSMALIDEGIRAGAMWAAEYFQHRLWEECGLRRADERREIAALAGLDMQPMADGGAGVVADYLRYLGPLMPLEEQLGLESGIVIALPSDAFALWVGNYAHFGQRDMARRMKRLEERFYELMDTGIPKIGTRVMDHGVCSGLLLLKYSTAWFQLLFCLKNAGLHLNHRQQELRDQVVRRIEQDPKLDYRAEHWWRAVVWSTAATAIHNLQQNDKSADAKPLALAEDPLAYLGILVDILEEWDRPSARRVGTVESDRRRINSGDVRISVGRDGILSLEYRCRDGEITQREASMRQDLDAALYAWEELVNIRFSSC